MGLCVYRSESEGKSRRAKGQMDRGRQCDDQVVCEREGSDVRVCACSASGHYLGCFVGALRPPTCPLRHPQSRSLPQASIRRSPETRFLPPVVDMAGQVCPR